MVQYALTPKGMFRGTIIAIEETVQQRSISELNEQERALIERDAQAIIDALGGVAMIEPKPMPLHEALRGINAVLDMADVERRGLNTLVLCVSECG